MTESPDKSTYEQLKRRHAQHEKLLLLVAEAIELLVEVQEPIATDEQIGPRGLCPGVQVVLVDRVATICGMLPSWNVEVELPDGRIETWWRGNLQIVLPVERAAQGTR